MSKPLTPPCVPWRSIHSWWLDEDAPRWNPALDGTKWCGYCGIRKLPNGTFVNGSQLLPEANPR